MFPVIAELNPADYFILKEIEGDLELLGFSISHSGKNKSQLTAGLLTVILPILSRCWRSCLRIIKTHRQTLQQAQKKR